MAITVDGAASDGAANAADVSIVVTAPAGSGGNLIASGAISDSGTLSPPAGWTEQLNYVGAAGSWRHYVWTRADDAAGSYTFTASAGFRHPSVSIVRLGGATLTGLVTANSFNSSSDNTVETPSITTTANNSLVLWIVVAANSFTHTTSGSQVEEVEFAGGGDGVSIGVYSETVAAISTPTSPTITLSGFSDWTAVAVAVAPAAGAGGVGMAFNKGSTLSGLCFGGRAFP